MVNKEGIRELCYAVRVGEVNSIVGADKVESVGVGGWRVMSRKGQFHEGDIAIYFEIDSKVPAKDPFMFLEGKHFKVKTQKYTFGGKNKEGFYSQGLLMSIEDFGGELDWVREQFNDEEPIFLTEKLGITYADEEDNVRKSNKKNEDKKYQRMMNRHPKLARSKFGRWCMKHKWAKKLLFLIFGRKSDKPKDFPVWVVKTDEERIQNLAHRLDEFCSEPFIATEKRDGSSTTMTMRRDDKKYDYAVCSRNVRMTDKVDGGWYESNIYVEMADKYHMKDILTDLLKKNSEYEFVTIQGETFGQGVQKRDYGLNEHVFEVFNVIFGFKNGSRIRLNPIEMKALMDSYNVPTVPIVAENVMLPHSIDEILAMAKGEAYKYGGMREGLVFRNYDGTISFKAVDNDFLLKYHS